MVPAAAELHLEGFSGYMNIRLGRRYVRSFIDWYRKEPEAYCLAAIRDGELAGYLVGIPIDYGAKLTRDLLFVAATSGLLRPWLLADARIRAQVRARIKTLLRGSKPPTVQPTFPTPAVSLMAICVSPKVHKRGVGDRLMEAFEDEARLRGVKSLRLSVYRENAAARKLYEKHGWMPEGALERDPMTYSLVIAERGERGPQAQK